MKLPLFLAVLIWLIVILSWVDSAYRYQGGPQWLDSALHWLGGIFVAGVLLMLGDRTSGKFRQYLRNPVFIVVLVMVIGLAWEFYEFLADQFILDKKRAMQNGPADTLSDLFFDFVGATMFVAWTALQKKLSLSTAAKSSGVRSG